MLISNLFCTFLLASATTALPSKDSKKDGTTCDCSGTRYGTEKAESKDYVCRDSRLGPRILPKKLPLDTLVATYDRFGGLTPGQFLEKYWDSSKSSWIYPEQSGFQLNDKHNAINGTMTLEKDTLLDRFGSEWGSYVSAATAPYSQRALPPSNLDTNPDAPDFPFNYHLYRVLKPFEVVGGPIAPWFGQPGLGAQFFTGGVGNIFKLIELGYIKKEDPAELIRKQKGCF